MGVVLLAAAEARRAAPVPPFRAADETLWRYIDSDQCDGLTQIVDKDERYRDIPFQTGGPV